MFNAYGVFFSPGSVVPVSPFLKVSCNLFGSRMKLDPKLKDQDVCHCIGPNAPTGGGVQIWEAEDLAQSWPWPIPLRHLYLMVPPSSLGLETKGTKHS